MFSVCIYAVSMRYGIGDSILECDIAEYDPIIGWRDLLLSMNSVLSACDREHCTPIH